jgi:hypothetical protein
LRNVTSKRGCWNQKNEIYSSSNARGNLSCGITMLHKFLECGYIGYDYLVQPEASAKFAGNGRLGVAIIYAKKI